MTRHPEVTSAILFGSRAKGAHREASDIDLALDGDLSALQAESIEAELEELSLPQTFDLCILGRVSASVREHIERVGVPIFSRTDPSVPLVSFRADGASQGVNLNSSTALLDILEGE
jgi:predicted nucleotidyltransferase